MVALAAISITLSWITWNDADFNPVYVGNFYCKLGVPKAVVLTAIIGTVVTGSIKFMTSYRVYRQDGHLDYMMKLISLVAGTSESNRLNRGIDPVVIEALKKEMKPLLAVLQVFIQVLKVPFLGGFMINIVCFYMISPDNLTSWKLVLSLFWATHYAFLLDQIVLSNTASFLITMIVCRFFTLTIKMDLNPDLLNSESSTNGDDQGNVHLDRVQKEKFFFLRTETNNVHPSLHSAVQSRHQTHCRIQCLPLCDRDDLFHLFRLLGPGADLFPATLRGLRPVFLLPADIHPPTSG